MIEITVGGTAMKVYKHDDERGLSVVGRWNEITPFVVCQDLHQTKVLGEWSWHGGVYFRTYEQALKYFHERTK